MYHFPSSISILRELHEYIHGFQNNGLPTTHFLTGGIVFSPSEKVAEKASFPARKSPRLEAAGMILLRNWIGI